MQKKISTIKRFLLPLLLLMVAAPFLLTSQQTSHQLAHTRAAAKEQALVLARLLKVTDELVSDQADSAMRLLKAQVAAMGEPVLAREVVIAGRTLPDLRLGATSLADNNLLVDAVSAMSGGTSTVFVKAGDDFVRIATNVKHKNGLRAIGTKLDPQGQRDCGATAGFAI